MELSNCSYELIFCPLANVQMRVVVDPLLEMDAPLAGNIIYHSQLEPICMVTKSMADGIVHVHLPVKHHFNDEREKVEKHTFTLLKVHHRCRDKATMLSTSTGANTSCLQVAPVCV